jgi:hypothetical protein
LRNIIPLEYHGMEVALPIENEKPKPEQKD